MSYLDRYLKRRTGLHRPGSTLSAELASICLRAPLLLYLIARPEGATVIGEIAAEPTAIRLERHVVLQLHLHRAARKRDRPALGYVHRDARQ